jgi:hypothetical protein
MGILCNLAHGYCDHRIHDACVDVSQHVVAIDRAPLIAARRSPQMMRAPILNVLAAGPVFLSHVIAPLPVVVPHVRVAVVCVIVVALVAVVAMVRIIVVIALVAIVAMVILTLRKCGTGQQRNRKRGENCDSAKLIHGSHPPVRSDARQDGPVIKFLRFYAIKAAIWLPAASDF